MPPGVLSSRGSVLGAISAEELEPAVGYGYALTLRGAQFLADYGVAISAGPLAGLAARAVVVIDENDQVVYSQLVNEITEEPDYDAALAALKA